MKAEVTLKKRVEAPVKAGQVVGEMNATLDGKEIGRMPLVAAAEVPKANVWQMIGIQLKLIFTMD